MYRLTHFKAINIIGFMSGTVKKTFELDLTPFEFSNLVVIHGDNASGKSTFLSLVHPWAYPTDGRVNFVVPGKEGTLVRTYLSNDGIKIVTKCYYHPRKESSITNGGQTHTVRCNFEVTKPGEEPIELNANGNVSSYYSLLYTYFGLTKEFLSFATYNNAVSGIVRMNDTERKNSVSTLIPNMKRYEVAYSIVNDKYKELRTLIRNVSQKILSLRDKESLLAELDTITREMQQYETERDSAIKQASKAEGRLKELTHGESPDKIIASYSELVRQVDIYDGILLGIRQKLLQYYDELLIDHKPDSIDVDGMTDADIDAKVSKYHALTLTETEKLKNYESHMESLRSTLDDLEKQIEENESYLLSMEIQDPKELEKLKQTYLDQIAGMTYAKHTEDYTDLSYDGCVQVSRVVDTIHQMAEALYDTYGELVTQYFRMKRESDGDDGRDLTQLQATIETETRKKDELFRSLVEREQYRKFQSVLDQRPVNCHIDTCPFLVNALKWQKMSDEIEHINRQMEEINVSLERARAEYNDAIQIDQLRRDANVLLTYIETNAISIQKYLGVSVENIYRSIEQCTWSTILSIIDLKNLAAILSEKDQYILITTKSIPEIDHALEIAKLYGSNKEMIESQISRLKDARHSTKHNITRLQSKITVSHAAIIRTSELHEIWSSIKTLRARYVEAATNQIELSHEAEQSRDKLELIRELKSKADQAKAKVNYYTELVNQRIPRKNQVSFDLSTLVKLKMEQLEIEQNFFVIDVIRSIVQPGKGIRKELINMYMYDIYQTANQLLLNTFNGNLYLKEFVITDKEFIIPYVFNGVEGDDISMASSSQQAAIAISLSMAILSKIMVEYGVVCFDEADATFSPANREIFIEIITTQMRYIGINQAFFVTQHASEYEGQDNVGFLTFPGGKVKAKGCPEIKI